MLAEPLPREVLQLLYEVFIARAVGEPLPGINALSAPAFDANGAIALAVTTLGPAGSFDAAWNGPLARKVRECADAISARLGYPSSST